MSIWEFTTIGDICELTSGTVQTGPFGSDLHASDYSDCGTPVIMPANLRKNGIVEDGIARVSDNHVERLSNHQLILNDIVFPRRGDVSRYAIISDHYQGWLCGTGCLRIRFGINEIIDPIFLGYWLGTATVEQWLLNNAVGTTMPNLNTSILKALPVPLPPLREQRAIAEVLGSLDDKIEANRRQNETLEATARAIFKSWFVDFDPVHARANGEAPAGMDAETAALFPDSFEESELGLIPSGWGVVPIGEAVETVGGSTPSTKEPAYWDDGKIHWTTPKDLSSLSSPVLLDTDRKITELGLQQISSGLLPRGTLILSSRAPVGYLAIAEIPVAINQGYIAMLCNDDFPSLYALFWTEANLDVLKNRASGTTFQEISKRNFRPIPALIPSSGVLKQFVAIVEPIYKQIVRNLEEASTLAETRDALLPRLVSGKLRVGEVE